MSRSLMFAIGDLIEIKYRMPRPASDGDSELFDRWIVAEIIDCDPDAWPLARLNDGQLTDIRPFMEWRSLDGWRHRAAA